MDLTHQERTSECPVHDPEIRGRSRLIGAPRRVPETVLDEASGDREFAGHWRSEASTIESSKKWVDDAAGNRSRYTWPAVRRNHQVDSAPLYRIDQPFDHIGRRP